MWEIEFGNLQKNIISNILLQIKILTSNNRASDSLTSLVTILPLRKAIVNLIGRNVLLTTNYLSNNTNLSI